MAQLPSLTSLQAEFESVYLPFHASLAHKEDQAALEDIYTMVHRCLAAIAVAKPTPDLYWQGFLLSGLLGVWKRIKRFEMEQQRREHPDWPLWLGM